MFSSSSAFLSPGNPYIKWMNLDPVKMVQKFSQFFSLEGFKKMLDKAEVRFTDPDFSQPKGYLFQTFS